MLLLLLVPLLFARLGKLLAPTPLPGGVAAAADTDTGIPALPKAGEDVRDEVALFPFVATQLPTRCWCC